MRRFVFLLGMALAAVLMSTSAVCAAQTDSIQYQLVIRDSEGKLVANKHVNMRFSLMSGGQTFYEETMLTTTNKYGNIDVMIGTGNALKGSMKDVPWSTMDISLKVDSDTDGGNNFRELGTVPIAAAPYAMYAATAGSNANNDSPKDGEPLFEVSDRNGQPVFAVYNDGIVVYVDESNPDKAKRSGLIVTGRRATKENGAGNDYFAVTTEGTHIYVDDADASKAKRSGLIVTGRRATKDDANDYLTIDAEGTHIFVDSASDDKAKRSGLIVTGRRATKDGEQAKILTIDANSTQIFIDDTDDSKAKRSGLIVTGRRATKDGESIENDYFTVTADGTQVVVDIPDDNESDTKAKRSGLIVTGRRATKAGSDMFAVNGSLTTVYVDDTDASKAKRSGLIVTGRRATKNDINYVDIDADRTILNTDFFNVANPGDSAFVMRVSDDKLWLNSDVAIDGELRQWLALNAVDEPYTWNVEEDEGLDYDVVNYDIMNDEGDFVVLAELNTDNNKCLPVRGYTNYPHTLFFDATGAVTDNFADVFAIVVWNNNKLFMHPTKPVKDYKFSFALINYSGKWNGYDYLADEPIDYRQIDVSVNVDKIEPSILIAAVTGTEGGEVVVNGKNQGVETYLDDYDDPVIVNSDYFYCGDSVTLEAKSQYGYIFTGWTAYSSLEDLFIGESSLSIGFYDNSTIKVPAINETFYYASFLNVAESWMFVEHSAHNTVYSGGYGGDDSNSGYDYYPLYSVEKAIEKLAGYNVKEADYNLVVNSYKEGFTIGSILDGKANSLTIPVSDKGQWYNKYRVFADGVTGQTITVNTTVPFGFVLNDKFFNNNQLADVRGTVVAGENANIFLQNIRLDSINLSSTASLSLTGSEIVKIVKLAEGQTIELTGSDNKATIIPAKYEEGYSVLTSTNADLLASEANNFTVIQPKDAAGVEWTIGSDGNLAYADGEIFWLTADNMSNDNISNTIGTLEAGKKYRFVAKSDLELSAAAPYGNLLKFLRPRNTTNGANGGIVFGESTLDLSAVTTALRTSSNYYCYVANNYHYSFGNTLTSITLPAKTKIGDGTANIFRDVQAALEEIKIAPKTSESDMWLDDNGALIARKWFTIYMPARYVYYLYCYPSQKSDIDIYTIPEGVDAIFDGAFYKNKYLTEIKGLENITRVGGCVFEETESLDSINLSHVETFESRGVPTYNSNSCSPWLFRKSNVKKVVLPDIQFVMGEDWFRGCQQLEEVEFLCPNPPYMTQGKYFDRLNVNANPESVLRQFYETNNTFIIRVPKGSVDKYVDAVDVIYDAGYQAQFADPTYNYLFYAGTYYITDGDTTAVGASRAVEAIAAQSGDKKAIIIGGSVSATDMQNMNTALIAASTSMPLDMSRVTSLTNFGNWFKGNSKLTGISLSDKVTSIAANAFNGTALKSTNLDAEEWFTADDLGMPDQKVSLSGYSSFADYLARASYPKGLVKKQTTFYVEAGKNGTSGSIKDPFGTVQAAFDKILSVAERDIQYNIRVIGTLNGTQTISGTTTVAGCAVTLIGDNRAATLNGQSAGTTLTITTSVPVTIKNLVITGGNNTEKGGGGLLVEATDNQVMVNIDEGTLITGNTAQSAGGGVLVYATGSKVAKVNFNGDIVNNQTTNDAAVDVNAGLPFGGGGVSVYGAKARFIIKGGLISQNHAQTYGNGVSVASNSTFTMDENAYVHVSNDVYLNGSAQINIGEILYNAKGAVILPNEYTEGAKVVSSKEDADISEICKHFRVTPQADGTEWEVVYNEEEDAGVLKKAIMYGFHNTPVLIDETTTGSNHTTGRYVLFGDYPSNHANITDDDVDLTKGKTMGSLTYYPGKTEGKTIGHFYVRHKVKKNGSYYNDGSNVENNNTYAYFELQPIKWRVLTTNYNGTGKALLMADSATAGFYGEADRFYTYKSYSDGGNNNRTIDGKEIHPNNYEYSKLRAWLNGYDGSSYEVEDWSGRGFLQSAFKDAAQQLIAETTIDNGRMQCFDAEGFAKTTVDADTCGKTIDKVFLLSRYEVTNPLYGFDDSQNQYTTRMIPPTDYAIASYQYQQQGNSSHTDYYGCEWLLRTPHYNGGGTYIAVVSNIGYAGGNNESVTNNYSNAIVPAICVDLSGTGIEPIGVKSAAVDENGALCGQFVVNDAGKTVQFSQGNLQFVDDISTIISNNAITGELKYRFAVNQYTTFSESRNKSVSERVDFFCWGGNTPWWYYQYASGYAENTTEDISGTIYDWGHYAITNGGNTVGMWTTLNSDEWNYLFNKEGKHGVAQVCGVNGLVLLPDSWTQPEGVTFTPGMADEQNEAAFAEHNSYNAEQWVAMENAGAVFLPAAGYRTYVSRYPSGIYIYEKGTCGYYWTSSPAETTTVQRAVRMRFISNGTNVGASDCGNGFSVRLVREVEP